MDYSPMLQNGTVIQQASLQMREEDKPPADFNYCRQGGFSLSANVECCPLQKGNEIGRVWLNVLLSLSLSLF